MMNYNSLSETKRFLASSATYEVNWRIVLRAPLYPYPLIRHDLNSARSLQLLQDEPSLPVASDHDGHLLARKIKGKSERGEGEGGKEGRKESGAKRGAIFSAQKWHYSLPIDMNPGLR